jgi:plasmid stabilization system protein ParE
VKKPGIIISPTAQKQYLEILKYLADKWPETVKTEFELLVNQKLNQVAQFPKSCVASNHKEGVYMAVIKEHNSFYYRIGKETLRF